MALTEAWTPLRFHADQSRAWRSSARFIHIAAGRGSGKTEMARRRAVFFLQVKKPWPDPMYFYALPTRDQAKRVAWRKIKALVPPMWIRKNGVNESEMTIYTVFGSMLQVLGMDKPQRAEGVQWDGGVVDESCDQKPGVFDRSLRPALSHRNGWCWRIGVPKRTGPGAREFKNAWTRGYTQPEPTMESYTWPSSSILSAEEIATAKSQMDPKDYSEQYDANWETVGGAVFYAFDEALNVDPFVAYDKNKTIVVGSDFNVDPMAWVLCHKVGDELHVFDELYVRNTNTPRTLDILFLKYGLHMGGWAFMGDASARARKTSATDTDYIHILNDKRFFQKKVYYRKSNPPVADRFAACNALCCNAAEQRRLRVHPKCANLIADLAVRGYKEGTREVNDSGDVGHITDALGYVIFNLFPIILDLGGHKPRMSHLAYT